MTTTMPQAMGALPIPRRYSPIQVVLHWLIAALVLLTPLLVGEGRGEGSTVAGLPVIGWHMIFGISILVLLLVRLLIRLRAGHPDWATTGSALLDRIGQWTHVALYIFTFAVTITGLIFAVQTNRLAAAFGGEARQFGPGIGQPGNFPPPAGVRPEGGERPGGFGGGIRAAGRFVFRAFHELSWKILLALIILHVAAALYHQFIRRDNLLGRMWFGSST